MEHLHVPHRWAMAQAQLGGTCAPARCQDLESARPAILQGLQGCAVSPFKHISGDFSETGMNISHRTTLLFVVNVRKPPPGSALHCSNSCWTSPSPPSTAASNLTYQNEPTFYLQPTWH